MILLFPSPSNYLHVPFLVCSMVAQDRLNRITKFVDEMAHATNVPSQSMPKQLLIMKSPGAESGTNWMASAIHVKHAVTLAAAAAGIISDEEASSRCQNSPRSARATDAADQCQMKDLDKDGSKACDDSPSENLGNQSDNVHTPDVNRNQSGTSIRSIESLFR